MMPKAIWEVVKKVARTAGIGRLAPHDLRRTCARRCHAAGGELEHPVLARSCLDSNDRTLSESRIDFPDRRYHFWRGRRREECPEPEPTTGRQMSVTFNCRRAFTRAV